MTSKIMRVEIAAGTSHASVSEEMCSEESEISQIMGHVSRALIGLGYAPQTIAEVLQEEAAEVRGFYNLPVDI